MNQDHFLRNAAQKQRVCRGRVASAHHSDGFSPISHAVAGGTVGDATANQFLFTCNAQFSGRCAGCEHHGLPIKGSITGFHYLGLCSEIQFAGLGIHCLCAKPLGLPLHLLRQIKTVNTVLKARIVINLLRQRHLSSGGQLFQNKGIQSCPGGV